MASNEIKIIVGGDASGLQKTTVQAAGALTNLQKSVIATSNTLTKFPAGANQATTALNNLSRIAQDAPFGFIGITNNINPLVESFQRLKVETGSTGGALKALGNSLLGAGGLGLAVGVGSALLTVFGDKLFGIGQASKKAKEDAEELSRVIRDISIVQDEAFGGVQGQIAQVNALASAVADSNRPYGERKRALEELRDINKSYFGDLQLEDAATGKLTKTIEEYNKALVATAIVKAFVDEITEVSKAAAKADTELAKSTTALAQAEKALITARATAKPVGREGLGTSGQEADAQKALITAFEEQRVSREKLLDIETQRAVLFDQLNKAQAEAIKFKNLETKGSQQEVDLLQKRLTALEKIKSVTSDLSVVADIEEQIFDLKVKITLRDAAKNGLSKEETDIAIRGFRQQLTEAFNRETLSFEAIPKVKVTAVEIAPLPSGEVESAVAKAAGLDKKIPIESERQVLIKLKGLDFVLAQEEAQKAVERLRDTVLSGAVDAFAQIGSSFGEALAGVFSSGGIGAAFTKAAQSLLSGIGGVLQEIGKQIIATSTLIKALKEALKSLIANPVAGIAIGLGLVALGGFLKNIKLPAFAGGVQNFSGGLALVGERGPELVNLPKGSDVIPNHMLGGGNMNVVLGPVVEFGYDKLRIGLQRQEERRRRM
jgi:hypothetical protein